MMLVLSFLFDFILTLLAIDFVSGIVHWAEDTFFTEDTPLFGEWLVKPNVLHHEQPAAFITKSWWQSSWDLVIAALVISGVAYLTNHLNWQLLLFCFLAANANQLHKYAHLSTKQTPRLVRFFQNAGILQKARHHALHHSGEKNQAYCVITPYLNPVLDYLGFWRRLEKILLYFLPAPRRKDLKTE